MSSSEYFYISFAKMHTIRRRVEKLKIEAYLVRLSVDRLPVIPGFVRPFANDSLMRMIVRMS